MTYICCPLTSSPATNGGVVAGGRALVSVADDPWDGMAGVWPLDELGNGSADEYEDRTRHALHGRGGDGRDISLVPTRDQGVFCQPSQHFDGRQFITLPPDTIRMDQGFSVSLWARIQTFYVPRTFFARGHTSTSGDEWVFSIGYSFLNQLETKVQTLGLDGTKRTVIATSSTLLDRDQWYHLAASWQPGVGLKVYVNGVLVGSKASADVLLQPLTNESYFSKWQAASHITGNMQDVRLHPEVRSAAWFKAEFDAYCGDFVTIGDEE